MKKYFQAVIVMIVLIISAISCKSKEDPVATTTTTPPTTNTSITRISGNLGTGYITRSTDTVDKVWALPLKQGQGGFWGSEPFKYKKEFTINTTDKSFEIDLAQLKNQTVGSDSYSGDWAFVLVDSQSCEFCGADYGVQCTLNLLEKNKGCIKSYLSISGSASTDNDSLVKMPTEQITESIDMGNVNQSTDGSEAQSTTTVDSVLTKISLDAETVKTSAKTDNIFKHLKNYMTNGLLGSSVTFYWKGDYSKLTDTTGRDLTTELPFFGAHVNFPAIDSANNPFTSDAGALSIEVPGNVSVKMVDDTAAASGSKQLLTTNYPFTAGQSIDSSFFISDPNGASMKAFFVSSFPSGQFKVKKGTTVYAYAELNLVDPFVGGDITKSAMYMPLLTLTKDPATKKITGVKVDWYVYKNGAYTSLSGDALTKFYENVSQAVVSGTNPKISIGSGQYEDVVVEFYPYGAYADQNKKLEIVMKMGNEMVASDFANIQNTTLETQKEWYYSTSSSDLADTTKQYAGKIIIKYTYAGVYFESFFEVSPQ